MTADLREGLRQRRPDFVATRDEARAYLEQTEAAFVRALLQDKVTVSTREELASARAQLATAEADVVMVDRLIDRWTM